MGSVELAESFSLGHLVVHFDLGVYGFSVDDRGASARVVRPGFDGGLVEAVLH